MMTLSIKSILRISLLIVVILSVTPSTTYTTGKAIGGSNIARVTNTDSDSCLAATEQYVNALYRLDSCVFDCPYWLAQALLLQQKVIRECAPPPD